MSDKRLPIDVIRHSASHVLAQAVISFFPEAKLGIGPAIENGFYYDFDLDTPITDEMLEKIEIKMNEIIKEKQSFKHFDLPKDKAIELMNQKNQPYKVELINDLNLSSYSFYENGPFLDLCKGPHCENTIRIPAIKLLTVSGAYWRGSEKNKMLQRIYGTAFHDKKALKQFIFQQEEAKKRDHRNLGKQLQLFSINDDIGSGLILWHPKGSRVRHIIESYWRDAHFDANYELLYSPHLGKEDLWKTSGHLDCYQENMYTNINIDNQDYYIKPMNCPFHLMVYKSHQHSYRDLPVRYAELGTVYRYERSGVLHGLMRVRGFTQDDAHIICRKDQVESEITDVLNFCVQILKTFGFHDFKTFISTRPEEKAIGDQQDWDMAQSALENAVKSADMDYEIDHGGGAFYGPKIDIKIKDAIGREWQCSTIQFDFNLPEKFDMSYINSEGNKERPYMIHRALLGSIERFFGILIEHYNGKFPTWLAPVQVQILSIVDKFSPQCEELQKALKAHNIRTNIDTSSDKIGAKIRRYIKEKVPYMIIIGENEIKTGVLSVRKLGSNDTIQMTESELICQIQNEVTHKGQLPTKV